MRKKMTKEITHTTVLVAKIGQDVNGLPVAEHLPELVLIGNVSAEKAQKAASKKYGSNASVFKVEATTETYEMDVEDFLKYATIKSAETPETSETT